MAYRFILSEQPADLTAGERDGLCGQGGGVDVAAHQNIHLLLCLHLRFLHEGDAESKTHTHAHVQLGVRRGPLTSWCILWYTFASLSRTTKDCEGGASPLKMKLSSPRWHFMSVKSIRVVSSLNQERETGACTKSSRVSSFLDLKTSPWPGYQQPAALAGLSFYLILIPCL